jgi:hypothetical protein
VFDITLATNFQYQSQIVDIGNITTNMLNWTWNISLWVNMLLHSDTLSWFRTNQSLLLFLKAVCFAEKGVSEWLLLNANSAIFHLHHGCNKLHFDEMMMMSALYKTNMLNWIFIGWRARLKCGRSLIPDRVKSKTIKYIFVASLLSMQR